MKKAIVCVAIVFGCIGTVYALSEGGPGGKWPASWPKELEPLRKQAWSWIDGTLAWQSYDIPFKDREELEAAWPHILKVKTTGAPIILMRGPNIRVNPAQNAGVRIRVNGTAAPQMVTDPESNEMKHVTMPNGKPTVISLILVVDGQIVDLNRIPLPADTPIVDERF